VIRVPAGSRVIPVTSGQLLPNVRVYEHSRNGDCVDNYLLGEAPVSSCPPECCVMA
jgi:hypothetical protein